MATMSSLKLYGPRRSYGRYAVTLAPDSILYTHAKAHWPWYLEKWPFFVCPGDWDRFEKTHEPFRLSQMHQLFIEKVPFRQTPVYRQMLARLNDKNRSGTRGIRTEAQIEDYFSGIAALHDSMREQGYLARSDAELDKQKEITVRVSRRGEFLKCGEGTHRHALALLLKLPTVPVVVDVVHKHWAQQQLARYGGPADLALRRGLAELASATLSAQDEP